MILLGHDASALHVSPGSVWISDVVFQPEPNTVEKLNTLAEMVQRLVAQCIEVQSVGR